MSWFPGNMPGEDGSERAGEQRGAESASTPAPVAKRGAHPALRLSWFIAALVALAVAWRLAPNAFSAGGLFLLILLGLVLAHEFAHFLTAKAFGVHVLEFGIGFPPRAWAVRFGETEYSVNWLPIGGFVRMLGEEDAADPRSLAALGRGQRFIVLVSGAVTNLVLPIFLFAIAFTIPHEVSTGRPVIQVVQAESPAEAAGFAIGDIIYAIDGRNVQNMNDAGRYIRLNLGQRTDYTVLRDGALVTLAVTPRWTPPAGEGPTGIIIAPQYPFTETVSQRPWESIPNGLRATYDTMLLARNELLSWFKGGSSPEVTGPVGIAQATGEVAREGGTSPLFELAALLSINLGILNLLPLPMLDGGRVFFLLLEVVRGGRRIAPEKEALVHLVGFIAFLVLAVFVTFADISRLLDGGSLLR